MFSGTILLRYFPVFLLVLLSSATNSVCAQTLIPGDSAEWKIYYERINSPNIEKELLSYYYNSDTLLIGKRYHSVNIAGPGYVDRAVFFLREGDSSKRVFWLYHPTDTVANRLLYDFSKGIGDSITLIDPWLNDTIIWRVINEGYTTINQQQKRFMELEQSYYGSIHQDRWIEGIGSVTHPFRPIAEPPGWFETFYQTVCFTNLATGFQYEPGPPPDTSYTCDSYVSLKEDRGHNIAFDLYPNPFNDNLKIGNPRAVSGIYSLLTTDGREILTGEIYNPSKSINIPKELPNGIYIFKIATNSFSKSFVLQKY